MADRNPQLPVLNAHLLPYTSTLWFRSHMDLGLNRLAGLLSMRYADAIQFADEWMDNAVRSVYPVEYDIESREGPDYVLSVGKTAAVVEQCTRLYVLLEATRRILTKYRMMYLSADFNLRIENDPDGNERETGGTQRSGFFCLSNLPVSGLRLKTTGVQTALSWDVEFHMDHPRDSITGMTSNNGFTKMGMHQLVVDGDSQSALFIEHEEMSLRTYDIQTFGPLKRGSADGLVKTGTATITFATLFQIFIEVLELRGVKGALGILVTNEQQETSGQLKYTLPHLFAILRRHSADLRQHTLSQVGLEHRTKVLGLLSIGFVAILELQRYCGAFTALDPAITNAYGTWIKALFCWDGPGSKIHNTLRNCFLLKSRLIHSSILHEHRAFYGDEQDRYVQGLPLFTEAFVKALVEQQHYPQLITRFFQLKLPGIDAHLVASLAIYDAMYNGRGVDPRYHEVLTLFMQVCQLDNLDVSFPRLPARQFTPVQMAMLTREQPDFSSPADAGVVCSYQRALMDRAAARTLRLLRNFFGVELPEPYNEGGYTSSDTENSEESSSSGEESP